MSNAPRSITRRRRSSGLMQTATFAGIAVTGTVCACAFLTIVTGCVLLVQGKVDAGREALFQGVALVAVATGLLARTKRDEPPASTGLTVEPPATVTSTTTATVES